MEKLLIVLFGISFFCCEVQTPHKKNNAQESVGSITALTPLADTIFLLGDTVVLANLVDDEKGVVLEWGILGEYLNTASDTLPFLTHDCLGAYKKGKYFIIEDGCGTGCVYIYLLVFEKGRKGQLYLSPLLLDLDREFLVYQGGKPDRLAIVENLYTRKTFTIKEPFDSTKRPYSLAIDTLYLEGNDLHLTWFCDDGKKMSKVINVDDVIK